MKMSASKEELRRIREIQDSFRGQVAELEAQEDYKPLGIIEDLGLHIRELDERARSLEALRNFIENRGS